MNNKPKPIRGETYNDNEGVLVLLAIISIPFLIYFIPQGDTMNNDESFKRERAMKLEIKYLSKYNKKTKGRIRGYNMKSNKCSCCGRSCNCSKN